jgi:hypothetical protein
MATPLVAGTAALIRQYLMSGYTPAGKQDSSYAFTPSAALMKAIILNSGQRLKYLSSTAQLNYQGENRKLNTLIPSA